MAGDPMFAQLAQMRQQQEQFTKDVDAGRVQYKNGMGKEYAANMQAAVDELVQRRANIRKADRSGGFGGFASSKELEGGFNQQARDAHNACSDFLEIAYRMQAAYLKADKDYNETDVENKLKLAKTATAVHY